MSRACTRCGASLAAETKFCTACGAAAPAEIPAKPAATAPGNPTAASAFDRRGRAVVAILMVVALALTAALIAFDPDTSRPTQPAPAAAPAK